MDKTKQFGMSQCSLIGTILAGVIVAWQPQASHAQQVLVNNIADPGSPNVTQQVSVPSNGTVQIDQGASIDNSGAVGGDDGISGGTDVIVNNAGTLIGSDDAIVSGVNLQLNNSGSISAGDDTLNSGSVASLVNSGSISAGDDAINSGSVGSLTNSGIITASDSTINTGSIGTLTNSGTISSTGNTSGFIINTGSVGSIINSGNMFSNGDIVTTGSIASVVNSGTMRGARDGIGAGTVVNLVNSGTIEGTTGSGIQVGTLTSLTNSGTIIGGTTAISATSGNDTELTLLPGSNIQGAINLGGGLNTLNVGLGHSIAHNFTGAPPIVGNTGGAPFAINANQVIVIDPTSLATARPWLDTISGAILNAVDDSTNNGSSPTVVNAGFETAEAGERISSLAALDGSGSGARTWGTFFGGAHYQEASAATVDIDLLYGGGIVGAEVVRSGELRYGAFIGGDHPPKWVNFACRFTARDDTGPQAKTAGCLCKQDRKIAARAPSPVESLDWSLGAFVLAALVGNLREHAVADVLQQRQRVGRARHDKALDPSGKAAIDVIVLR